MGFGDFLGVKSIKIQTKEPLEIADFYEKIKDVEFEPGQPELVKHGFNNVIAFPPEDRENQVWIMQTKKGEFVVQRSVTMAGFSNMVSSSIKAGVMDKLTGGVTGMISTFGSPKKACMAHCDSVAEKIKSLDI